MDNSITVAVLLTVCELFSRIEFENRHVCPLRRHAQQYQRNLYISEKYIHLVGYNSIADSLYGSIFIRVSIVASQICEITQISEKI